MKNERMEIANSVAPKATLPQAGRYGRRNSSLAGASNSACASTDMITAVLRWTFLDNDKGIRFMRLYKGVFSTIVMHDNPIFDVLHYNLESIRLVSLIVRLLK